MLPGPKTTAGTPAAESQLALLPYGIPATSLSLPSTRLRASDIAVTRRLSGAVLRGGSTNHGSSRTTRMPGVHGPARAPSII